MKPKRAQFGDQHACERCGLDIEFHGKPRRETIAPRVSMVRGGWMDRGSGRFCPGTKRLHVPYRP